jgi:hypothetical protein
MATKKSSKKAAKKTAKKSAKKAAKKTAKKTAKKSAKKSSKNEPAQPVLKAPILWPALYSKTDFLLNHSLHRTQVRMYPLTIPLHLSQLKRKSPAPAQDWALLL